MKKLVLLTAAGYLGYNILVQKKDLDRLRKELPKPDDPSGLSTVVINIPPIHIPPMPESELQAKIEKYIPKYKLILSDKNYTLYWQVYFNPIKISLGPIETTYQPKSINFPLVAYFSIKEAIMDLRNKVQVDQRPDGNYTITFKPLEIKI